MIKLNNMWYQQVAYADFSVRGHCWSAESPERSHKRSCLVSRLDLWTLINLRGCPLHWLRALVSWLTHRGCPAGWLGAWLSGWAANSASLVKKNKKCWPYLKWELLIEDWEIVVWPLGFGFNHYGYVNWHVCVCLCTNYQRGSREKLKSITSPKFAQVGPPNKWGHDVGKYIRHSKKTKFAVHRLGLRGSTQNRLIVSVLAVDLLSVVACAGAFLLNPSLPPRYCRIFVM